LFLEGAVSNIYTLFLQIKSTNVVSLIKTSREKRKKEEMRISPDY